MPGVLHVFTIHLWLLRRQTITACTLLNTEEFRLIQLNPLMFKRKKRQEETKIKKRKEKKIRV